MPAWFGPTETGAGFSYGEPHPGETPAAARLARYLDPVTAGVNVYLMTDGTVTTNDPIDWTTVAHALYGAHVEPITAAEASVLTAAGYGAYIS